jgi:hypothetical protein
VLVEGDTRFDIAIGFPIPLEELSRNDSDFQNGGRDVTGDVLASSSASQPIPLARRG